MGAFEAIWNAKSITLNGYNTVAPGNRFTTGAGLIMDGVDIVNETSPTGIINYSIYQLDQLYKK